MKKYFPIILIFLIACVFRFASLDKIPTAISGDELLYSMTAKSVYLTGHDISGTWNPLSAFVFRHPPREEQAELPYFLHLLTAPFPFSLLLAKLPFAILSVGIVILLSRIAAKLFNEQAAIATGLIAAVNPWLVVMGRTGYESTPATFFYLLGLYLLLTKRAWSIVWSILPFTLAFYSYIGTKLIFIPFIAVAALISYLQRKQYKKQFIFVCLFAVLFTAGYLILLKTSPSDSRISELFLPNSVSLASSVNDMRRTSIQLPFTSLAVNKYTLYMQEITAKMFRIFSPTYLFVEGDQFFLPARQSFFYYIDFLFLALGSLFVFTKKRAYFFLLWAFVLLGTFPHLFHKSDGDFSGHLALMFPFMLLLIGAGVADTILSVSKRFRAATLVVILVVYVLNISSFAFTYFYRYPLVGSSDFPMRILTTYLTFTSRKNIPVIIYSNRSGDLFKNYLFYSNGMNSKTMPAISRINTRLPFEYNNVRFTDCDEGVKSINPSIVTIYDTTCMMHIDGARVYITKLLDGGRVYGIYNDRLCSTYSLNTYPSGIQISDFGVERLSEKKFCETFITR